MGFLNDLLGELKNKKEEKHSVAHAASLLTEFLQKKNFSMEYPDLDLAWKAFKEFCLKYQFECNDDAILWEIGPYCWLPDGSRAFQWHLVRQFICGTGEDDDMLQLCFDLNFPPEVETDLRANLWSYDFGGDFKAFFTAVEARPDYKLTSKMKPVSLTVSLEQV